MNDGPSIHIVTTWKGVLKNGADIRESLGDRNLKDVIVHLYVRGIVPRQFSLSPPHA
jgi:hypothetical protein